MKFNDGKSGYICLWFKRNLFQGKSPELIIRESEYFPTNGTGAFSGNDRFI